MLGWRQGEQKPTEAMESCLVATPCSVTERVPPEALGAWMRATCSIPYLEHKENQDSLSLEAKIPGSQAFPESPILPAALETQFPMHRLWGHMLIAVPGHRDPQHLTCGVELTHHPQTASPHPPGSLYWRSREWGPKSQREPQVQGRGQSKKGAFFTMSSLP